VFLIRFYAPVAGAHNVSKRDASFVEPITAAMAVPYLGAKHMVTGYALMFLVGVIFFVQAEGHRSVRQPFTPAKRHAAAGVLAESTPIQSSMPSSRSRVYKASTTWTDSSDSRLPAHTRAAVLIFGLSTDLVCHQAQELTLSRTV